MTEQLEDANFKELDQPNRKLNDYRKGKTGFYSRADKQRRGANYKQPPLEILHTERANVTQTAYPQGKQTDRTFESEARLGSDGHLIPDTEDARRLTDEMISFRDFDDPAFRKKMTGFFLTPRVEAGELMTHDYSGLLGLLLGPECITVLGTNCMFHKTLTEDHRNNCSLRTCMVQTSSDDWNGTNYINHWRPEVQLPGQDEQELDFGVTWAGFTIFELPRLDDDRWNLKLQT